MLRDMFSRMSRSNVEVFKMAVYTIIPIGAMYYAGVDPDKRFGIRDFWPAPETLNYPPHEFDDVKSELARMKEERKKRRESQEQKLKELEELEAKQLAILKSKGISVDTVKSPPQ
ncbi:hypothetical protein CANCADRAFT_99496 [Tortispora caseinolytica NRRL Y-17796]|uniref:Mitochondrial cytochrome c oxidase assembly factor n=1 Tax=Tortispora caseinolytica NRRL Y-17796 TaxID=767744 RepID=A0A1E4TE24_9ASCO|nr:hypothetical protein CANCADRAFT_99496 [Tortispora caseinolytica NRRL Y-17796]